MTDENILRKTIITAAVTGAAHSPSQSAYLPVTPKQIADDAVRSFEAGAAIAHIHARNPDTGEPTPDLQIFREILTDIKSRCNVILCITTGGAGNLKERIEVVPEFKPELATLNCGSFNAGVTLKGRLRRQARKFKFDWEEKRDKYIDKVIFENSYRTVRQYAQIDKKNSTRPELEIWDVGQINAVRWLLKEGLVERPLRIQFVMGSFSGMPATAGTLVYVYGEARRLLGDFSWSVATIGRWQLPMSAVTLAMEGDVRVGLEDSLYAGYGRLARRSAEQVERVVKIAQALSIEPATPDEARQMLGLKGLDKVNF